MTTADQLRNHNVCIPLALGRKAADELDAIDALRPPCPTCGGDWEANCPDCVDGKVSVEQLVATWRAVHAGNLAPRIGLPERQQYEGGLTDGRTDTLLYLRAVKP